MNEKTNSVLQKAQQERKRGQFAKALKRLEAGIAAQPDELDLYLEAIDVAIDGGELLPATNLLKTVQEKFTRERERVLQFVREKLQTVHDPSLARCVVEHAVKRRDLEGALELLGNVPDHTIRELLNRAKTKAQSLKSASHGGQALRGETVGNELTNAVLSVKVGNFKEAMATLIKVLEEKPVEQQALDPFLAALTAKYPKSGRLRHGRGYVQRVGGHEAEAIEHFVEAARLELACAASCIEQLQAMLEKPRRADKIRRALAEVMLIKGDLDDAARTLREYLAENPDNAREVIILLRPSIEPARGLSACTWLAIEKSLQLEQSSLALEILRGLHQHGGHSAELFSWLEVHSGDGFLPPDVMMFHGSLAIDQKRFQRAAEILGAVCSVSPQDVHAVLAIIDRHRSANPMLDALYKKNAPKEETTESSGTSDESDAGDFQTFESNEFHLESSLPPPAAPRANGEKPKPRFNTSPFSAEMKGKDSAQKTMSRKSFIDAKELTLDDDGGLTSSEGETAMSAPEPFELTESHVDNVAQQLYQTGAATFFHIDEGAAGANQAAPEPVPAAAPAEPAAPAGATPAPIAPVVEAVEPEPAEPFATRYERFSRGGLSNAAVLELLEDAVTDGRVDEIHELLFFEPETSAEHFARYYYQAEYLVMRNRPLQALEILARLDTPDLDTEQKRRIWYKIAVAQRMTQNYEGAATTLERLVQHFPDREDLVRLKRRNHEQFIEEQSLAAPTLEKTSSLD